MTLLSKYPVFIGNRARNIVQRYNLSRTIKPIYTSYEQAAGQIGDYEAAEIIEVVKRKTKQLKQSPPTIIADRIMLQNLFVISHVFHQLKNKPLTVLDLGGALGGNFFILNHFLPQTINQWLVVETPAMSEVGNKEFKHKKLSFIDYHQLKKITSTFDLLFLQGVLHYTPSPINLLEKLLKTNSSYVYISRQPLVMNLLESIVTVQTSPLLAHGPGKLDNPLKQWEHQQTQFPITLIPKKKLEACLKRHAYRSQFTFDEEMPYEQTFADRSAQCVIRGYLLGRS